MKVRTPLFYALSKSLKQGKEGGYINARTRGKTIIFQRKPHPRSNTPAQASWRAKYSRACKAWNALSDAEKELYNERAAELDPPITGFNLFVREYLLAPEEKLYEHYNTGDDGNFAVGYVTHQAQTFTVGTVGPNEDHTITKVRLKLKRSGTPGILRIAIKATDENGLPTGPDLSTGSIDGNTLTTTGSGEWYEIEMSEYTLRKSTKYAIVASAPESGTDSYVIWRGVQSEPTYTGGSVCMSTDYGETWEEYPEWDLMFEVYGKPA